MRDSRIPSHWIATAAGVFAIVLLWLTFSYRSTSGARPVGNSPHDESWQFIASRDSRNLGLSDERCDLAFPKLYTEIDRARDHFGRASIGLERLKMWTADDPYPHGQVHVLIHSGQMYILDEKKGACDRARAIAGLSNLYRAIVAVPDPTSIPNVEFIIDIEDTPTENVPADRVVWAWNRPSSELNTWVMPDFDGWAFPEADLGSYISFRDRLRFYEKPFDRKDPRAVWRGAMNNPTRHALLEAAAGKPWADVQAMSRETRMHMAEFCAYQYPVHTEGNTWSGRLRYLQNCNSISVIHDLTYRAHYYDLLEAEGESQNYIHVQRDFSDLEKQIKFYRDNPALALRVAKNSVGAFRDRYLTPAAEACYWRRMIRSWAEVQNFEPTAYLEPEEGSKGFRKQRGIDWEIWVNPDPNFPFK